MTSTSMQYPRKKYKNIMQLPKTNKHQKNYSVEFYDDTDYNIIHKNYNNKPYQNNSLFQNSPMRSQHSNRMLKTGNSSPMSIHSNSQNKGFTQNNLQKKPLKKGTFSYKKEFISEKKTNYNYIPSNISYEIPKTVLYDDINIMNHGDDSNKIKTHFSANSIDLNKYKILSASNSTSFINMKRKNSIPTKKNELDYTKDSTPLSQFKIEIKRDQVKEQESNFKNDGNPFSPVLSPVIINNINVQSITPMNINSNNNNNIEKKKETITTIESFAYFRSKKKYEQASRRMIIELLKQEHNENTNITNALSLWKLDPIVLEQEKQVIKPSNPYLCLVPSLSRFNQSSFDVNVQSSTNISSPLPMNKFISEMNDEKKDRINMINFLSVPRVMDMIINNEHIPFIFVLSPNSLCYLYGIETYVFKWREFKDHLNSGYFDLMKIINCIRNRSNPNQFHIKIEDGIEETMREITYDIEAPNTEICKTYIECLNFLTQLIKCKAYQRKSL